MKYTNHKTSDMQFQIGENVFLKVLPIKGVMLYIKKLC